VTGRGYHISPAAQAQKSSPPFQGASLGVILTLLLFKEESLCGLRRGKW
jgi:hypothetical protein